MHWIPEEISSLLKSRFDMRSAVEFDLKENFEIYSKYNQMKKEGIE